MKFLRGAVRLVYLVIFTTLIVAAVIVANVLFGFKSGYPMRIRRFWAGHSMWAIGMKIQMDGTPPDFPCLVLCNHRSSMDPMILLMDVMGFPVSKAEVAKWPVLGYGAKASGILFLHRESAASRKETLTGIVSTIKNGWPIILFPEGTTVGTPSTGTFKRGTFAMAAKEGIPVVPVALEYGSDEDYWLGTAPFLPHFMDRFGQAHVYARIRYGAPIVHTDAELLLTETKAWIDTQLAEFRQERQLWAKAHLQ
jgi:1-acyl-sn-glycerol-3-phosphate acyltransferase